MTDDEILRQAFGLALRSLRRRAGFSQEQLAMEGFARSHVSDLERGYRDPKLSTLFLLCQSLGIPLVAFVREIERNYARITSGNSQDGSVLR